MIDLHFHCLPDLDDGPATWESAVELCRAAAADGTDTIVATPHVLRDFWVNDVPADRDERILRLNTLLGGTPRVLPGCEYWYSAEAPELIEKGAAGPLTTLNRGGYLLVEFPPGFVHPGAEAVFHELVVLGVTPLVAHPERNLVFATNPDRLEALVAAGAVCQVTASSVAGDGGRPGLSISDELFRRGLVHVIASDAHSVARRPPRLTAAREAVRKRWGAEAEAGLFEANPAAITEGRPLPWRLW